MSVISKETIDKVRSQADIVQLLTPYVSLSLQGKSYQGLCPFHQEKTPSFHVYPEDKRYHCFGCGQSGDVFNFFMEMKGLSFPEAVKEVAVLENISVELPQTLQSPMSEEKKIYIHIYEKVSQLYQHILLNTEPGEVALNYLVKQRHLSLEQIKQFQLGYAPPQRNILHAYLVDLGFSSEDIINSGVVIQKENGAIYDRFTQRIMYPIWNESGQVVAFSGRLFLDQAVSDTDHKLPKYINSPESKFFKKSKLLYNYSFAKAMIKKTHKVYIFEGYMDVIASWGAGIYNVTATMGTHLSEEHIYMLSKLNADIILAYDGDHAGIQAIEKSIDLFNALNVPHSSLYIVTWPDNMDPDEYIRYYGIEAFQDLLDHHRLSPFLFRKKQAQMGKNLADSQEFLEYLELVMQALRKVDNLLEQEIYLKELSEEYDVPYSILKEELAKQGTHQEKAQFKPISDSIEKDRYMLLETPFPVDDDVSYSIDTQDLMGQKEKLLLKQENRLLFRLLEQPKRLFIVRRLDQFSFFHDPYQQIYQYMLDLYDYRNSFEFQDLLSYIKEETLKQLLLTIKDMPFDLVSNEETFIVKDLSEYLHALTDYKIHQRLLQEQNINSSVTDQEKIERYQKILELKRISK